MLSNFLLSSSVGFPVRNESGQKAQTDRQTYLPLGRRYNSISLSQKGDAFSFCSDVMGLRNIVWGQKKKKMAQMHSSGLPFILIQGLNTTHKRTALWKDFLSLVTKLRVAREHGSRGWGFFQNVSVSRNCQRILRS